VFGPVTEITTAAFDKIIDVNLRAPLEVSRRALPSMTERGHGSVINIASIGGISPEQGLGFYSVSKAALISLTKVMADEWGASKVRANAICPGFIRTDFSATLWKNDAVVDRVLHAQPIQRLGEPEDISGLALFLASDAAAFCTGAVYMADGGYLL
jgi:dehydrogenase/reductase SDR family member 4